MDKSSKPDARRYVTIDGEFAMRHGRLVGPTIAYETWGALNARRDNAVLIFTGLSPSAHVCASSEDPSPGWWQDMVGPGRPIDSARLFVVCINSLGSCFGSTGPASVNPATGEPYRLSFPVLTIEDIAAAGALVLDHLDIGRLHAVVGASMGGMTALAFTALYPGRAAHLVAISAAASSLPFALALRSLQREIIRKDPAWRDGNYPTDRQPITGMRLARKLGMITYRSAAEWAERFGRSEIADAADDDVDGFGPRFEVEAYLEAVASKFVGDFDANCYLYLSRSMDLFDLTEHGGSLAGACRRLELDSALIVGVGTDFLFPVHQQRQLAQALSAAAIDTTFEELASIQGHDSFLIDMDRFCPVVERYFRTVEGNHG